MKILLACCSGMSTSLLVNKMKDAAKAQGLDDEIWAVGQGEVEDAIKEADVLLIGPQMRMLKKKMTELGSEIGVPVDVIPPVMYGRVDGAGVLKMGHDMKEKA